MPSEFPRTTPAKPKVPPSGNILTRMATGANWRDRPRSRLPSSGSTAARPHIATVAAHGAGNTRDRIRRIPRNEHRPRASHNRHTAEPSPGARPGRFHGDIRPRVRRPAGNRQLGRNSGPAQSHPIRHVPPCSRPPAALFFFRLAPYIGGAGSPAMEINGRRNKPFGPGGSTRRLHPSPPFNGGFRRGRNRIDEGVKGEFFLGMVPPLSGYAIVANDNYAPVAQAA